MGEKRKSRWHSGADPFEAAKKALEDLQGKVDLTICIYHGGFESDLETGKRLSETTENIGYKICTELGFDVLLTGHQHMPVAGRMVNGTYTLQPLANGREYAYVEIDLEKEAFALENAVYPAAITSINQRRFSQTLIMQRNCVGSTVLWRLRYRSGLMSRLVI